MLETRQIENTPADFGIKRLLIYLASLFLLPPPPPPPSPPPPPPIRPRLMIYGEFLSAEAATKPTGVLNRRAGDIPALNIHYRAPELCALQKATPPPPKSSTLLPQFIYLFKNLFTPSLISLCLPFSFFETTQQEVQAA